MIKKTYTKIFLISKENGLKQYKLRIGYQNFKKDLERVNYALQLFGQKKVMIDAIMGTLNKWEKKTLLKN